MTTIIFCADPLRRRQPDPIYAAEYAAAQAAGFTMALLDYEALVDEHDAVVATRQIAAGAGDARGIYRGWMLTPPLYQQLYDALAARGTTLINTPEMYRHTHYLPESYPVIQAHTPQTVWRYGDTDVAIDNIMLTLAPFGDVSLILKDFVKSRKHEWYEACYIPSATDRVAVERVVRRFVALQGDALNEGLVFRAFVPLVPLATHSKSAMPLAQEFRRFWLDGHPLATAAYWDEGEYDSTQPPADLFAVVAHQVQSRFFTMDVARTLDDEWIIIELDTGGKVRKWDARPGITFMVDCYKLSIRVLFLTLPPVSNLAMDRLLACPSIWMSRHGTARWQPCLPRPEIHKRQRWSVFDNRHAGTSSSRCCRGARPPVA